MGNVTRDVIVWGEEGAEDETQEDADGEEGAEGEEDGGEDYKSTRP